MTNQPNNSNESESANNSIYRIFRDNEMSQEAKFLKNYIDILENSLTNKGSSIYQTARSSVFGYLNSRIVEETEHGNVRVSEKLMNLKTGIERILGEVK